MGICLFKCFSLQAFSLTHSGEFCILEKCWIPCSTRNPSVFLLPGGIICYCSLSLQGPDPSVFFKDVCTWCTGPYVHPSAFSWHVHCGTLRSSLKRFTLFVYLLEKVDVWPGIFIVFVAFLSWFKCQSIKLGPFLLPHRFWSWEKWSGCWHMLSGRFLPHLLHCSTCLFWIVAFNVSLCQCPVLLKVVAYDCFWIPVSFNRLEELDVAVSKKIYRTI